MRQGIRHGDQLSLPWRRVYTGILSQGDDRSMGHVLCRSIPTRQRCRSHALLGGTREEKPFSLPPDTIGNRPGTGMDASEQVIISNVQNVSRAIADPALFAHANLVTDRVVIPSGANRGSCRWFRQESHFRAASIPLPRLAGEPPVPAG